MSENNESSVDNESRRRKLHLVARELGFTREDRIDLAEKLLWRDVESWKDLSSAEVTRLLDAFEGYELISFIRDTARERQPLAAFDPEPSGSSDDSPTSTPKRSEDR